jgi:hypothetical protein
MPLKKASRLTSAAIYTTFLLYCGIKAALDLMSKVLLYNITGEKLSKIRIAATMLGHAVIEVPPESFGHPLGYLLGLEGFLPSDTTERFEEEMLVMEALSSPLLDALRAGGTPVALKAVVTEQNKTWSAAALCRELKREHEAMRAFAPKKHVHPHKKRR